MRREIVEDIVVVGVRNGRRRMREGDVVATVVVTLIACPLIVSLRLLGTVLVLRLPESEVLTSELNRFVLGLNEKHVVSDARLRAVLAYFEKALDLLVDNGPLRLFKRLFPATKVVIAEDLNVLVFLVLGEHWVDQEDRREECLFLWVNWLFVPFSHLEGLELW